MGDGRIKRFRIVGTSGNHVGIELEKREMEEILFMIENTEVENYKAIRKMHEGNNHKSADKLIVHYRRAGLIGPETVKIIKAVVNDCRVCQKFRKSLVKPKTALPIAS